MGCAVLIVMSTQISWELTLLALLPMPLMALAINRYGEQLHERFKLAQAAFSSVHDRHFRQHGADAAVSGAPAFNDIKHPGQRQHRPDHQPKVHRKAG